MAVCMLAACLGMAAVASGCSGDSDGPSTLPGPGPDADPRVVASAEGVSITASWFEQTYIDFLVRSGANDTRLNRWAHLDYLIDSMLLAREFEQTPGATSKDYRQFVTRVEREELGSRYFETGLIDTMSAPTDRQVREAFQRSKEKAIVRHLYFTSPREAEASWARLEAGVPFLEEARRVYGLAQVDSMAGYLGAVGYYSMDDAFAEAAWELAPGTWSRPVRTRFGWHIILLEQLISSPLLAESAYLTARSGISSQYRLRRRRLEGDTFVRRFMEQHDVQVHAQAISALSGLIRELDPAEDDPVQAVSALNAETLGARLDENAVLATYAWEGDRAVFTAGDYTFWLESLPQREARERTGASVGRALRNELLWRAADEAGLRDGEWKTEVRRRVLLESAARMRRVLRTDTSSVDPALVRQAYERLGLKDRRIRRATFSAAVFPTHSEAEEAAQGSVAWTVSYTDKRLEEIPAWSPWVATLPLDEAVVVGRPHDWAVIRVEERTSVPVSWDRDESELTRQLAPRIREFEVVRHLRAGAAIEVDTTLFNSLMAADPRP